MPKRSTPAAGAPPVAPPWEEVALVPPRPPEAEDSEVPPLWPPALDEELALLEPPALDEEPPAEPPELVLELAELPPTLEAEPADPLLLPPVRDELADDVPPLAPPPLEDALLLPPADAELRAPPEPPELVDVPSWCVLFPEQLTQAKSSVPERRAKNRCGFINPSVAPRPTDRSYFFALPGLSASVLAGVASTPITNFSLMGRHSDSWQRTKPASAGISLVPGLVAKTETSNRALVSPLAARSARVSLGFSTVTPGPGDNLRVSGASVLRCHPRLLAMVTLAVAFSPTVALAALDLTS